ncbi:laminin domain protein, putative, partial [Rhizoctonia solani AG-3 Rhs1AP]
MSSSLVSSPPDLPAYLKGVYNLNPVIGAPSDDEVIRIHAVMQMAQKAVDIPGTGNPALLVKLAEHLFNVQMARYRIKYLTATLPENTTYTPPTLPSHLTVQLKPVVDAPSDEDIIGVQNAIQVYS